MQTVKITFLIFITLFTGCFDKNSVTAEEESTKQMTIIGIISYMPDPCIDIPNRHPSFVYSFATASCTYILTLDSRPILIVEDTEYSIGDIVTITGSTRLKHGSFLEKYYELEIKTIIKSSLNQDNQRFWGAYILDGRCLDNALTQSYFPQQGEITLSKGSKNELLFSITPHYATGDCAFYTFASEDSLFIPFQWSWVLPEGTMCSITGKGKMENDSIFLNMVYGSYGYDFSTILLMTCNCKGEKIVKYE